MLLRQQLFFNLQWSRYFPELTLTKNDLRSFCSVLILKWFTKHPISKFFHISLYSHTRDHSLVYTKFSSERTNVELSLTMLNYTSHLDTSLFLKRGDSMPYCFSLFCISYKKTFWLKSINARNCTAFPSNDKQFSVFQHSFILH